MNSELRAHLVEQFEEIYGRKEEKQVFFAPGRVNLIGEHIDYNGGYVLPCAITLGTYAVVSMRNDNILRLYSENFKDLGIFESTIDFKDLQFKKEDNWTNYPKGVISVFKKAGYNIDCGMDILYYGNIPNGAGLSSSASIEVLTAFFMNELFDLKTSLIKMALLAQKAENTYVGVNCGIMDQFAIAMGRKNRAILLKTDTLEHEYIPLELEEENIKLVIINTNKVRLLSQSKYNERRNECNEVLAQIKKDFALENLCNLSMDIWEHSYAHQLENENPIWRRALHVISENDRVKEACINLRESNFYKFGILMNESHHSLRYNYEVTGIELDTIFEQSRKQKGVYGVRMTGAGFGGCAIALVNSQYVDDFINNVKEKYTKIIGYAPSFYIAEIGTGPRII